MNNYITKEGYIIKKTIHNRDLIAEINKQHDALWPSSWSLLETE